MRKLFLLMIVLFATLVSSASANHAPENLTIVRFASKSVTIGWNSVAGVMGYGLYVDGTRVATAGAAATQAKFGTPTYRQYVLGVQALKAGGGTSTITVAPRWVVVATSYPEEPPPPPTDNAVPVTIAADCSVDVSASLQAWVNSRPDNSTLVFPQASCYRVEAGLSLVNRTGLVLAGTGSTLRATSVGDGHRSNIRMTNGSNITVRGFRLEGGYTTPGTHNTNVQWSHGVDVLGTQTVLVEDVTVMNVGGDCVYLGLGNARTRNATVRRMTCNGTGRNGVSFVAADNSLVEQSSTNAIGYVSMDVEPNSGVGFGVNGATMTENTIGSYVINAMTIVGDNVVSDVTFNNNQIIAPTGGRIQVTGLPRRSNVTISGNIATNMLSYPQAIRLDNVDGAVVTNNNIPVTGVMLRCASVTGLTFSGNTPNTSDGCTATPPPSPNGANVWVDANGGTCVRSLTAVAYVDAQSCGSFAAAYTAAFSGDTIGVTGSLGIQKFAGGYQSAQGSGTKTLLFKGVAGNKVRQINFGSPNLTFDGINIDATGPKLDGAALENGGDAFTLKNGSVGNVTDEKGALVDGPGIVFDNVVFHDVIIATNGVHSECIFAAVPEGMIVRNSTFTNCAVMDIFFVWPDWWSPAPPAYGNVTLEGNTFNDSVGSCCALYVGGTGPNDTAMRNWTVRNNDVAPSDTGQGNVVEGAHVGGVYCGNTGGGAPASWKAAC